MHSKDEFEAHNINRDFTVVVVRSSRAFRAAFRQTIAAYGHRRAFAQAYPKIFRDGLASDQMGIFLVGRNGVAADPNAYSYDTNTGTVSLRLIFTGSSSLKSAIFFPAEYRRDIQIHLQGTIIENPNESMFPDLAAAHKIEAKIDDTGARTRIMKRLSRVERSPKK